MQHSKTTWRQKLLKKRIGCAAPRESFLTFNYFIALIFAIFTVFWCEPEERKEDRARQRRRREGGGLLWRCGLRSVFVRSFWSASVRSPRTRVVTDRGKQDYTILSLPINYLPVWGNKFSLSRCAIAVEYSPFLMVGELQIQLWGILESRLLPSTATPTLSNQEGFFHTQLKLYRRL